MRTLSIAVQCVDRYVCGRDARAEDAENGNLVIELRN
jgi:hypothetical protein